MIIKLSVKCTINSRFLEAMSVWEKVSEEAGIVLVGNFNPKIFHPAWFIHKGIIEEWDYSDDEIINVPDMSQLELPSSRKLTILLNLFSLRSTLASDHVTLKDLVTSTFSILGETPILQMGMNYACVIKIHDKNNWMQFSRELAPHNFWEQATGYFQDLNTDKQDKLGLWDMTMNLPRPDDLPGHIRAKIAVNLSPKQTFSFSINNHVEIEDSTATTMAKILDEKWEESQDLSHELISNIMDSQLKDS